MTYKNALAGIPYSGSKILVQCAPVDLGDFETIGFFAYISIRLEDIYTVNADVFFPCAIGGIITEDMIDTFKFDTIIGLANNQLRATSQEGEIEIEIDRQLVRAGILFIVEFTYN
jgi:glutamate dehydrogenase/leucine dehydrogenase